MTKIFFLKADINSRRNISSPNKRQISKIFKEFSDKKPSLIEKLPRSTLGNSYLVEAVGKKYVLKTNPLKSNEYKILKYIEGKSLYDLSNQIDITKYIKKLGDVAAKIHMTKTKGYGPAGAYGKWSDYFFLNLNKHLNYLKNEKVISSYIYKQINEIYKRNKIVSPPPRLLHGDLANHNVILSKGEIKLIDWEDSISGDPLYEIAYFLTGVYKNEKWLKAFLAGYEKVAKKQVKFNHLFWLYFLRIAIVKAVIRQRWGSVSSSLPDFSERISFAVDKIKAEDYTL